MKIFGIDNVRVGSYCNINLSNQQIDLLNKELCTTNNTCYRCCRDTHFANLNNNTKMICYRCGRDTHYERNCYANISFHTHINGRNLNDTILVAKSIFRYFKY